MFGIIQSDLDLCMFIGIKFIVISWVEDLLIYSPKEKFINEAIYTFREKVDLPSNHIPVVKRYRLPEQEPGDRKTHDIYISVK